MRRDRQLPGPKPLDPETLRSLALAYVARYATTGGKLQDYLKRKLRERGWTGDILPEVGALADTFAELGYIDDAAWAEGRSAALKRKGLGERRIRQALSVAGIKGELAVEASRLEPEAALWAALRFASRRRIGPYGLTAADRALRDKWRAAMARAGHAHSVIETVLNLSAEEVADLENSLDPA